MSGPAPVSSTLLSPSAPPSPGPLSPTAAADVLLVLLDPPDRVDERALQRDLGALITQVRTGGGSITLSSNVIKNDEIFNLTV